jgi:hypothetical protein
MFHQASDWLQELAFRESDRIEVALLWDSVEDRVLLNVRDGRTGEWFVCGVDRAEALDAFRHPFPMRRDDGPAPSSHFEQLCSRKEADDAPPRS